MILASFATLTIYLITIIILTSEGQYDTFLTGFIFAWISGAINAVLAFLLLNLILLHVYLMAKGISTYEFIVAQREEDRKGRE